MTREFNDTGNCIPSMHYMVDIKNKIQNILVLIEKGKYFTINRPRQYGKTTTISLLWKQLLYNSEYLSIRLSFEGIGDAIYESKEKFCERFIFYLKTEIERTNPEFTQYLQYKENENTGFDYLSILITNFIKSVSKKIIIIIDEIDKSTDNQLFLHFLGLLRDKYLKQKDGTDFTFHAVVLAGVHDVKSLKLKINPETTGKLNSPWNIAADFNIEMSFNPAEIATMLVDYANDKKIEMNIPAISDKLYFYTSGYPYLVSKMCKIIDEEILPEKGEKKWDVEFVDLAYQSITYPAYTTTIFDDLFKNLENNPDLFNLVFQVAIEGEKLSLDINNPLINLGVLYGVFSNTGNYLKIHNHIFNQRICNYLASKLETSRSGTSRYSFKEDYLDDHNQLNMKWILQKFQIFYKEQYSKIDQKFVEREGRLLFLAFLKPIINGDGYDFKEITVSMENRMDIVVTFQNQRFVIELKIWHGEEYHQKGLNQLNKYLDIYSQKEGYLIIFDFNVGKQYREEMIQYDDKQIFAVWV